MTSLEVLNLSELTFPTPSRVVPQEIPRVLADEGAVSSPDGSSPLLVTVAGVHGNEASGVHAVERVRADIQEASWSLLGRWVAFSGNRAALAAGSRFVDRDLNRIWPGASDVECQREDTEARERAELLGEIRTVCEMRAAPVAFLDLHSTSAAGAPFMIMGDTLQNREIAFRIPAPTILGLEENVEGTLVEYFCEQGYISMCFEAGSHYEPETIDRAESCIWLTLEALGLLPPDAQEIASYHRARLLESTSGVPQLVEIVHRHGLQPGHGFEMNPGYDNFCEVEAGELLAQEDDVPVRAPRAGMMLMPLYQPLGDDGYFLVRRVRPIWLAISKGLRTIRGEKILRWLPGVRVDRENPRRLVVNQRVARYLSREIFHLFGYHRQEIQGEKVIFVRRHEGRANHRGLLSPPGTLPRDRSTRTKRSK